MRELNVLVACEQSQVITEQFILLGHRAMSCDKYHKGAKGLPHYKGDVLDILNDGFDLMIGHPDCTRLTNAVYWYILKHNLQHEVKEAADFFLRLLNASIPHIAIENPIQNREAKKYIRKQNQVIQPYNFGDDASKATCLWVKNLPLLTNTSYAEPRIVNGKKRWSNQTDGGWNKLPPDGKHNKGARAKERSQTYVGVAKAIAEQYSNFILSNT